MVKSNQYEIKIATDRIQDAYESGMDTKMDAKLGMANDQWVDDWQVFSTWILTKYAGRKVLITVQEVK